MSKAQLSRWTRISFGLILLAGFLGGSRWVFPLGYSNLIPWTSTIPDPETGNSTSKTGELRSNTAAVSRDNIEQVVERTRWPDETLTNPIPINSLAFSPDGSIITYGSNKSQIFLRQVSNGALVDEIVGQPGAVDSLTFSPDGRLLASGIAKFVAANVWDDTVQIWRVSDRALLQTMGGPRDAIAGCGIFRNSVAFSQDSALIAAAGYDHTIRLWRVSEGTLLKTLEGHLLAVLSVAFSPDGKLLASASNDDSVRIWQVSSGKLRHTLPKHLGGSTSIAFSPDGALLASGEATGMVRLWRVTDGELVRTLEGDKNTVSNLVFSPDGALLVAGGNAAAGSINIWNVADGVLLHTLAGHTGRVNNVAFSPNGELIASGSVDGTVRLWGLAKAPLHQP